MKAIVVGAGLSGATAAFVLKREGFQVEVFEERPQVGGNCFDYKKDIKVTGSWFDDKYKAPMIIVALC